MNKLLKTFDNKIGVDFVTLIFLSKKNNKKFFLLFHGTFCLQRELRALQVT